MSIEQRRKFLKGFGIFGALAAGAATTHVVIEKHTETKLIPASVPKVDPNMVTMLEEQATNHLQLTHTYGELAPPPPPPPRDFSFAATNGSMLISNGGGGATWTAPSFLQINANGGVNIGGKNKQFVPGTENEVSVKMVPGPDGELYLNVNGEWKRVLTA